ncbi:MAG: GFA family protein [Caulobacteraceae bacterium]|nr:GFA family protein [Caulobacteraceae bacterium]
MNTEQQGTPEGGHHTGGCLCGAVRYRVSGPLPPIQFCHCSQCRKAQGGAFAANIPVSEAALSIEDPQGRLTAFESSPGKLRVFCGACGSPIYSQTAAKPGIRRLRAGSLDAPVQARPGFHIFADSCADWWPILDTLPRYSERAPD